MALAEGQKLVERPVIVSWIATLLFMVGFAGLAWFAKEVFDDVSQRSWQCIGRREQYTGEVYNLAGIFISMIGLAFGFLLMRAWALWGIVLITVITLLLATDRFFKTNRPIAGVPVLDVSPIKIGLVAFLIIGLVLVFIFRKRYLPTKKLTLLAMMAVLLCFNFFALRHLYYNRYPIGFYWSSPLEKVAAIPSYPGAQNITNRATSGNQYFTQSAAQQYRLGSTILLDDVLRYYLKELTSRGWEPERQPNNALSNVYQKGGYRIYLSLHCSAAGKTYFLKSCSENPATVFNVFITYEKINRDPVTKFTKSNFCGGWE